MKIFAPSLVCFFLFFSGINAVAQNNLIHPYNMTSSTEDFEAMVFGNPKEVRERTGKTFHFTVVADFISGDAFCKLVSIRVMLHEGKQVTLIASDNVKIGDCGEKSVWQTSGSCSGALPDGNFIIEDKNKEHFCLYEVLTRNTFIYENYRVALHQFFR